MYSNSTFRTRRTWRPWWARRPSRWRYTSSWNSRRPGRSRRSWWTRWAWRATCWRHSCTWRTTYARCTNSTHSCCAHATDSADDNVDYFDEYIDHDHDDDYNDHCTDDHNTYDYTHDDACLPRWVEGVSWSVSLLPGAHWTLY